MRFYQKKNPDINDIIIGKVQSIKDYVIKVELLEYENKIGYVILNNLSKRNYNKIMNKYKVNYIDTFLIRNIDIDNIDLSIKNIKEEEITNIMQKYRKLSLCINVFDKVVAELNILSSNVEELANMTIFRNDCYDLMKRIRIFPEDIKEFKISDEYQKVFSKYIKQVIRKTVYTGIIDFNYVNYSFLGINDIKKKLNKDVITTGKNYRIIFSNDNKDILLNDVEEFKVKMHQYSYFYLIQIEIKDNENNCHKEVFQLKDTIKIYYQELLEKYDPLKLLKNDVKEITVNYSDVIKNQPTINIGTCGSVSEGKCLGKGTNILKYDGTFIKVENITINDIIMGDDSTPRKILSITKGYDKLYKVINQNTQEYYIVNSHHIITIIDKNQIKDIPISQFKEEYYGYKTLIEYNYKSIKLDPYLVGYHYLDPNYFEIDFELCLYNSSHIRYLFLAGIIDSYARPSYDNYIIYTSNIIMTNEIQYLCRSLGLECIIEEYNGHCNSIQYVKDYIYDKRKYYHKLIIYGDTYQIPIKKLWKKIKSKSIYYPIKIEEYNYGEYYGFETDGNHRFVLGDFSITHNSTLTYRLSGVKTQKYSEEKKTNCTIHIGYANVKIYRNMKTNKICIENENENCELIKHISIVDVPGHENYMTNMMSGSSTMDAALAVIAANNSKYYHKLMNIY